MAFRLLNIVFFLLAGFALSAQPEAIDSSFGTDGYVEGNQLQSRVINCAVFLKDSNIISVGTLYVSGKTYGTVAKYSANGELDRRFGNSGLRNFSFVNNGYTILGNALRLKDGNVMLAGTTYDYSINTYGTFLLKINSQTGNPDSTFDNDGMIPLNALINQVDFLKEDSNGNILFSIYRSGIGSTVFKFNQYGLMDSAFMATYYDKINKPTIMVNTDLIITAKNQYLLSYRVFASRIYVELYDTNGRSVKNAAINGKIDYNFRDPYYLYKYQLIPDTDTSFYAAAAYVKRINVNTGRNLNGVQILKYDYKGNRILSFGLNGIITLDMFTGKCYGIDVIRRDNKGRYVIGFNVEDTVFEDGSATPLSFYDAILCRLKSNGTYDSSFNGTGIFRSFKDNDVGNQITDVLIDSDNRIIAAGYLLWSKTDASQFLCRFRESSPVHHSGIQQIKNNNVNVYPIPFSDHLYLDGIIGQCHYTFFDMKGRKVKEGIAQNGSINALEELPSGVYVLRLDNSQNPNQILRVVKE